MLFFEAIILPASSCLRDIRPVTFIVNYFTENNDNKEKPMKPHYISVVSHLCSCCVIQFMKAASSHSDANANRGGVDERTSIQTQRPATLLPVYMTQDRLTLAVLTLLLGGWLAIAFTFPIVSRSGFILMNKCKLRVSEGEYQRKMLSNSSVNL